MFYFDLKINIVDIIVNLVIVILTTSITYYLFSVLPSKRRLSSLKVRLSEIKDEITEHILDSENEFKESYTLYEEESEEIIDDQNTTVIWSLIKINDWENFYTNFSFFTLLDTYFHDYWQGRELMLLINNFIMDNKKYIELSTNLSKLGAQISHTKAILGAKGESIWEIKSIDQLIKSKEDNEHLHIAVSSLEDIFETSKSVVKIICELK